MTIHLRVEAIRPCDAAAMWEPALEELCARTAAMWASAGTPELDGRWRELAAFAPVYAQLDYDRGYQTSTLVIPSNLAEVVAALTR